MMEPQKDNEQKCVSNSSWRRVEKYKFNIHISLYSSSFATFSSSASSSLYVWLLVCLAFKDWTEEDYVIYDVIIIKRNNNF